MTSYEQQESSWRAAGREVLLSDDLNAYLICNSRICRWKYGAARLETHPRGIRSVLSLSCSSHPQVRQPDARGGRSHSNSRIAPRLLILHALIANLHFFLCDMLGCRHDSHLVGHAHGRRPHVRLQQGLQGAARPHDASNSRPPGGAGRKVGH